jgi:hypothetical protein
VAALVVAAGQGRERAFQAYNPGNCGWLDMVRLRIHGIIHEMVLGVNVPFPRHKQDWIPPLKYQFYGNDPIKDSN